MSSASQRRQVVAGVLLVVLAAAGCTTHRPLPGAANTTTSAPPIASGSSSSTATSSNAAPGAHPARFEKADCRFQPPAGYDVSCGYLVTLQDRTKPTGLEVRLHVGTFHKQGVKATEDPIVYLEGGPGGNALMGASQDFDGRFGGYAATRDIVVFDQRGTGYSEPHLDCQALDDLVIRQLESTAPAGQQLAEQQATLGPCRDALAAKGVDLSHYNSVDSAADVAELRQVLGYASWNVHGVSYGTRLAQTLMRTHPEGIRSVVLDSTFPVAADPMTALPGITATDYQHFFDACRTDAACNSRYPDLANRFQAQVDQLNRQPIKLTATDFVSGKSYPAAVNGTALANLLFEALYTPVLFTAFPQLIADLEQGRHDSLTTFVSNSVSQLPFITLGAHLAVECNEEVAFADPAAVKQAAQAHPELSEELASQIVESEAGFETCRLWGAGRAGPEENQPVQSNLPTLILSGGFDPITPGEWGRQVGQALPRSFFVSFPPLGHGVSLEAGCAQEVAIAFLASPTIAPDSACASRLPPAAFTPPASGTQPIALDNFTEDVGGVTVTGKRPSGWASQGPGAVGTQRNVLDQAALLQQAAPGASPSTVVSRLRGQLGVQGDLARTGSVSAGGISWTLYRGRTSSNEVDLALGQRDGTTLVALLLSSIDQRDELFDKVLRPAMAALRVA